MGGLGSASQLVPAVLQYNASNSNNSLPQYPAHRVNGHRAVATPRALLRPQHHVVGMRVWPLGLPPRHLNSDRLAPRPRDAIAVGFRAGVVQGQVGETGLQPGAVAVGEPRARHTKRRPLLGVGIRWAACPELRGAQHLQKRGRSRVEQSLCAASQLMEPGCCAFISYPVCNLPFRYSIYAPPIPTSTRLLIGQSPATAHAFGAANRQIHTATHRVNAIDREQPPPPVIGVLKGGGLWRAIGRGVVGGAIAWGVGQHHINLGKQCVLVEVVERRLLRVRGKRQPAEGWL